MYIMQVKTPAESKAPWDYYKLVEKMSGEARPSANSPIRPARWSRNRQ